MQKAFSPWLKIGICTFSYLWATSNIVSAQVTPDGTTNTVVNSDGSNFNIGQGDRAGNNLFHSFNNFSVPTNGSAVFNNAADITNIFNRVTGGNISNIDGLIQANGSANLFLVNPAGIIFGNNARLDIGGSFLGTTADSILFEDGTFSAIDLDNPPLLTINAPIGLNLRDNPEPIVNSSFVQNDAGEFVGLEVIPGNNISLVGGDINFDAGEVTARGGRVELGGLSSAGTVTIEPDGSLTFPDGINRANVTFSNAADVDVVSEGGGSIFVNANNIDLIGGEFGASTLRAGISFESTSADAQAGDINFNATGTVTISDGSFISNSTFGVGNAGQVQIESIGAVELSGNSTIFNTVEAGAVGDSQGITIDAQSLSITEGSQLTTSVQGANGETEIAGGRGNAGSVIVDAGEAVLISGSGSAIFSQINSGAVGNAGNIEISANSLALSDEAFLINSTLGTGNAGSVLVDVAGAVNLNNNAQIFSIIEADAIAEEGLRNTVLINAGSLSITEGSFITSSTFGQGNAGNISIIADSLALSDRAFLSNSTFGIGNAGSVSIDAAGAVNISNNALIFNNVEAGAEGDSLGIEINAQSLSIVGGSQIQTLVRGSTFSTQGEQIQSLLSNRDSALQPEENSINSSTSGQGEQIQSPQENPIDSLFPGQGNAGNIDINVKDAINISGLTEDSSGNSFFSQISSTLGIDAVGSAGDINITAGSFTLTDGALFSSSTFGEGNAGNVSVDVADALVLSNDSIIFNTVEVDAVGDAGDIQINASSLTLADGAFFNSSTSGEGNAGNINIQTTEQIDISGEGSAIFSNVGENGEGNGGNISLETRSLFLTNEGEINNSIQGRGDAGEINISAEEVNLINGEISTEVDEGAVGNAGSIILNSIQLSLRDEAELNSSTSGEGNAGNINIVADQISLFNGEVSTGAESGAVGSGGNIDIFASDFAISGTEAESFSSGLFANTEETVNGDAGSIAITTRDLRISNSGTINVNSLGEGNGGNVEIQSQSLELDNNASISSTATSGFGGNANIQVEDNLVLSNNSTITTGAFGDANGGNVLIDAGFIIAFPSEVPFNGNDIIAQIGEGSGGDIDISTEAVFGLSIRQAVPGNGTNDISAVSTTGNLDLTPQITVDLPDTPQTILSEQAIDRVCRTDGNTAQNSFRISGKGGVPADPVLPLDSANIIVDGQVKSPLDIPPPIETSQGKIQLARGIEVTESGEIRLVAYPTNNAGERLNPIKPNCS